MKSTPILKLMQMEVNIMSSFTKFIKSYRFLQVLTGVSYLFMALLALKYRNEDVIKSLQLIGVFSLLKGFFEIMNRGRIESRTNHKQYSAVILGVVDLIVGIILIINISLSMVQIAILFGIWFISDAVISFFMLDLAKRISMVYYYISLVIDLLGGLIGLILLVANNSSIISTPTLIGCYFLLFGLTKLAGGLINKKNIHTLSESK